ncbi:MAG: 2-phospho-L-lactate guanylyltransferase [bacterium]
MNVVLIPIKELGAAKSRLRPVLGDAERERLVLGLAEKAIRAALEADGVDRVLVVSRDPRVLARAAECRAQVVAESSPTHDERALNRALDQGRARALELGATALAVLVADLPTIEPADVSALFEAARGDAAVVLARSHDGAGLGALVESPIAGLPFHFGDGRAFEHHLHEARTRGLGTRTLDRPGLALDLDTTDDWARHRDVLGRAWPVGAVHDRPARVVHTR